MRTRKTPGSVALFEKLHRVAIRPHKIVPDSTRAFM